MIRSVAPAPLVDAVIRPGTLLDLGCAVMISKTDMTQRSKYKSTYRLLSNLQCRHAEELAANCVCLRVICSCGSQQLDRFQTALTIDSPEGTSSPALLVGDHMQDFSPGQVPCLPVMHTSKHACPNVKVLKPKERRMLHGYEGKSQERPRSLRKPGVVGLNQPTMNTGVPSHLERREQ